MCFWIIIQKKKTVDRKFPRSKWNWQDFSRPQFACIHETIKTTYLLNQTIKIHCYDDSIDRFFAHLYIIFCLLFIVLICCMNLFFLAVCCSFITRLTNWAIKIFSDICSFVAFTNWKFFVEYLSTGMYGESYNCCSSVNWIWTWIKLIFACLWIRIAWQTRLVHVDSFSSSHRKRWLYFSLYAKANWT